MFIFLLSVCLPLNSGLTRNKREPQEIPNPGYQLYRYEMCILPGMACALHENSRSLTRCWDDRSIRNQYEQRCISVQWFPLWIYPSEFLGNFVKTHSLTCVVVLKNQLIKKSIYVCLKLKFCYRSCHHEITITLLLRSHFTYHFTLLSTFSNRVCLFLSSGVSCLQKELDSQFTRYFLYKYFVCRCGMYLNISKM